MDWTREANWLTDLLYFDTDCLSAFLWVREESIPARLYPGKIRLPQQVYNELSIPAIAHLKKRVDALISNGDAVVQPIFADTAEYSVYSKLTSSPDEGHSIIGKGEAAVIALASASGGIVASNNLKDVAAYVSEMKLRHITTGDILARAFEKSFITEADGNRIWNDMLAKRRKLGAVSFTEYLLSRRSEI
jgi:predicted nucleic acid-binding protein